MCSPRTLGLSAGFLVDLQLSLMSGGQLSTSCDHHNICNNRKIATTSRNYNCNYLAIIVITPNDAKTVTQNRPSDEVESTEPQCNFGSPSIK